VAQILEGRRFMGLHAPASAHAQEHPPVDGAGRWHPDRGQAGGDEIGLVRVGKREAMT
jgi:hypothetical protein